MCVSHFEPIPTFDPTDKSICRIFEPGMDAEKKIKDKAREIRRLRGWSQQEIADRLGWSKSKYSRFEGKGHRITVNDFFHVCEIFEVGITGLAGATTAPQRKSIKKLEGIIKKEEATLQEVREVLRLIDPRR